MDHNIGLARVLLESRARRKRRRKSKGLPPSPLICDVPMLFASTLEEALEDLMDGRQTEELPPDPRIARLRERDQHTVSLLLVLGFTMDDDEEIARGVTKGAFFEVAYRVAERICNQETAATPR